MTAHEVPVPIEVGHLYDQIEALLARLWDENFHYGYWDGPQDTATVSAATDRLTDLLIDRFEVPQGGHVLDVGCGIGKPGVRLVQRRQVTLTGISVSPTEIERANTRARSMGLADSVRFQIADAMRLPFADNSFDGAMVFQSIMHMPNRRQSLSEVARVLRPSGSLLLTDFYLAAPMTDWQRAVVDDYFRLFKLNKALYDLAEYRAVAASLGLEVSFASDIGDERCKRPTMKLLGEVFTKAKEEFNAVFGPEWLDSMSRACHGFSQIPQCGLLTLTARKA